MIQKIIYLGLPFLIVVFTVQAQDTVKIQKFSAFKFESIFGMTASQPKNTYCLLGTGFFRTPRSSNADSLLKAWFNAHNHAMVVPVTSFGPASNNDKDSRIVYCWIIDGADTLNNYLVSMGCFPGETMSRPKTWDEMQQWEKDLFQGASQKPEIKVHIEKNAYDAFLEQIRLAEIYAKEHKLGIWSKN